MVKILSARAAEKNLAVIVEALGKILQTIGSDPAPLRRVLTSLLGNGIEFTESRGVRLSLRLDRTAPHCCADVIDSGIGVSVDKSGSHFESVVQAGISVTRRFGGIRRGLSIRHCFARPLGGNVVACSPLDGIAMLSAGALMDEDAARMLAPEQGYCLGSSNRRTPWVTIWYPRFEQATIRALPCAQRTPNARGIALFLTIPSLQVF